MSSANAASFRTALTRLFDIGHSLESEAAATLEAIQVSRYILKQPRDLFRNLCLGNEKARQWLQDGIRAGSKSYLVIELQTATNPKVTRSNSQSSNTDANITVPVSTIATQGADILGLGPALDSSLSIGRSMSNETKKTFETEGETIFAIGYKKVTWKSWGFKRKQVDKAMLDTEITWSILGQKRSRDDEDEMISVDLADELVAKTQHSEDEDEDEDEDDEGEGGGR